MRLGSWLPHRYRQQCRDGVAQAQAARTPRFACLLLFTLLRPQISECSFLRSDLSICV